jgi:FAD:protein FMN transferase
MPNFTIEFRAMGSHIQAWLNVAALHEARLLERVPGWFEDWENQFSRFRPDSELCRLNRRAGQWTQVSPALFEVIALAVRGAGDTNGLFNPLILSALEAAGYDHSFDPGSFVPGHRNVDTAIPDYRDIELNRVDPSVRLPERARLDLGGNAKGWSAQQAASRLAAAGPCLVDAGGDVVAVGSPDDSGGWLVSIPHPITEEIAHRVLLTDSAIATSGRDYRRWLRGGQAMHHIIDPRTGQPSGSDWLSASVIAPDAAHAEIWAKAALIDGISSRYPTLLFGTDGSSACNEEFETLCKETPLR